MFAVSTTFRRRGLSVVETNFFNVLVLIVTSPPSCRQRAIDDLSCTENRSGETSIQPDDVVRGLCCSGFGFLAFPGLTMTSEPAARAHLVDGHALTAAGLTTTVRSVENGPVFVTRPSRCCAAPEISDAAVLRPVSDRTTGAVDVIPRLVDDGHDESAHLAMPRQRHVQPRLAAKRTSTLSVTAPIARTSDHDRTPPTS